MIDESKNTLYNQKVQEFLKLPISIQREQIITILKKGNPIDFMNLHVLLTQIPHIEQLPYYLIDALNQTKSKSEGFYNLLGLYDALYLQGYSSVQPIEKILPSYQLSLQEFHRIEARRTESVLTKYFSKEDLLSKIDENSLANIIESIQPITRNSPFCKIDGLFSIQPPIAVPLQELIDKLHSYFEDFIQLQRFLTPIENYNEYTAHPKVRQTINYISNQIHKGDFRNLLRLFSDIQKLEPKNPLIPYLKAKVLDGLASTDSKLANNLPHTHFLIYQCLKDALDCPDEQVRIEFYFDLVLNLGQSGHFKAQYILGLILLQFMPSDVQLLIQIAYAAYQLFLDYTRYLYMAAISDPKRVSNFINQFWFTERFRAVEKYKGSIPSNDEITQYEENAIRIWQAFWSTHSSEIPPMELLGQDFPLQQILGFNPDIHNNNDHLNVIDYSEEVEKYYQEIKPFWEDSSYYASLPKYTHKYQQEIILDTIFFYNEEYDVFPDQWDYSQLEHILVEVMPDEIDAPKAYWKAVARTIANFYEFIGSYYKKKILFGTKIIIQSLNEKIIKKVTESEGD
jgi:hypothetical protein